MAAWRDSIPWGTLDASSLPAPVRDASRVSFVDGAVSETMTAVGFAELSVALLNACAPHELSRMASTFVGEELLHAELNARIGAELGASGAMPTSANMTFAPDASRPPIDRALELALRVSCVGEAFSVPLLGLATRTATHPLVRAVLARIVRDEPRHARLRRARFRLGGASARCRSPHVALVDRDAGGREVPRRASTPC